VEASYSELMNLLFLIALIFHLFCRICLHQAVVMSNFWNVEYFFHRFMLRVGGFTMNTDAFSLERTLM